MFLGGAEGSILIKNTHEFPSIPLTILTMEGLLCGRVSGGDAVVCNAAVM